MGRIVGALAAAGWFALISAAWLAAAALSATLLLRAAYAFDPLDLPGWNRLYLGFLEGGSVPFGFVLGVAGALLVAAVGEIAILCRLPALLAVMPAPALPRLAVGWPDRSLRAPRPRAEPALPPSPAPPPSPPPPTAAPAAASPNPERATAEIGGQSDSATLARIFALFDVWNEPPPSWMAEALRDEVLQLSSEAWPTLEMLGPQGLKLLITLQQHGMLPESPAALKAIGAVEEALRSGLEAEAGAPGPAPAAPALTLPASWLCEALENLLAAKGDIATPPERLTMAEAMLGRAMRGMADEDWASLDLFPEKAGRVRVLTDQLREDLRRPAAARPPPAAAAPIAAAFALLRHFGFTVEGGGGELDSLPALAQREDLVLLIQTVDLGGADWRMPQGLLGCWYGPEKSFEVSPARQLWQQLARRRLRRPDPRPLAGLMVLHGGRIENEEQLAALVAADRRRSGIGLVWLTETGGALPGLQQELSDLPERLVRERRHEQSTRHSASHS